jgi:hypothetical protein
VLVNNSVTLAYLSAGALDFGAVDGVMRVICREAHSDVAQRSVSTILYNVACSCATDAVRKEIKERDEAHRLELARQREMANQEMLRLRAEVEKKKEAMKEVSLVKAKMLAMKARKEKEALARSQKEQGAGGGATSEGAPDAAAPAATAAAAAKAKAALQSSGRSSRRLGMVAGAAGTSPLAMLKNAAIATAASVALRLATRLQQRCMPMLAPSLLHASAPIPYLIITPVHRHILMSQVVCYYYYRSPVYLLRRHRLQHRPHRRHRRPQTQGDRQRRRGSISGGRGRGRGGGRGAGLGRLVGVSGGAQLGRAAGGRDVHQRDDPGAYSTAPLTHSLSLSVACCLHCLWAGIRLPACWVCTWVS